MKKYIVFFVIFYIVSVFVAVFVTNAVVEKKYQNPLIEGEFLEDYVIHESLTGATEFYKSEIGDYTFFVSTNGDERLPFELKIYRKVNGKGYEFFGGTNSIGNQDKLAFDEYYTTFQNSDGEYESNSMILFSDNKLNISEARVKMKEGNEIKEETYDLDSNKPFVIKIDNLDTTGEHSRTVVSYDFYDKDGKRINPLYDKNVGAK